MFFSLLATFESLYKICCIHILILFLRNADTVWKFFFFDNLPCRCPLACNWGLKTLRALSYTRHNATPGVTQVFFATFSPKQLSFSCPALCCLNSKCTCAHLFAHERAGLKTRCVQAHCRYIAILRQLKPIAPLTN